jgi:hypothetical protein
MSPEQLEFILTQYLDGTLSAEQEGAIERALEADPRARELRDEHERLTALLRAEPLPEMNWDELARDLSAVVTGTVDEESKAQDRKLNAILKGLPPLPQVRWEALAGQISAAVEAELERADVEDEKLDQFLKGMPTPEVNWEQFAGKISQAIAAEHGEPQRGEADPVEREERPAVIGRIGWVRTASRLAMAACVVLAATLGIRFYMHGGSTGEVTPVNPGAAHPGPAVVMVDTPKVEISNKPAVAEISIGPSKAYVANADQEMYRSGVASRSAVVIASPVTSDEDGDRAAGLGFD